MINVDNIDFTIFYDCGRKLCEMYKQELQLHKVNASGTLSNSADFDVDFDENEITLYFQMTSYWYYIEHGRKPTGGGGGQPWANPMSDIETWIKNKISRGYWIPKQNQSIPRTPQELKRVAYVIKRKIHNKGFYGQNHEGKHILENVLKKAEANGLIDKMIESVAAGLTEGINVEIQKL